MILGLVAWGVARMVRAPKDIRARLAADHYEIVQMEQRFFRLGPLFWTTARSQIVYRVIVRDVNGFERSGWARWGRRFFFEGDLLEFVWDK